MAASEQTGSGEPALRCSVCLVVRRRPVRSGDICCWLERYEGCFFRSERQERER